MSTKVIRYYASIHEETHQKLRIEAAMQGVTMNTVLMEALEMYFDSKKKVEANETAQGE